MLESLTDRTITNCKQIFNPNIDYRKFFFSFLFISIIIIIIIIIIVSEKPPWVVENKICFLLYCVTSHFSLHVDSVAQW